VDTADPVKENVMEPDKSEPLEPDAVFLKGEGEEGRRVNADKAHPPLTSVNVGRFSRFRRGGGRGGAAQQTSKERGERDRTR
jgi:hypothetical protein